MTIADIILAVRRKIPDMPQTLQPPIISNVTTGTAGGSNGLPAGVYYLVVTQSSLYGESAPCAELGPYTVGANGYLAFDFYGAPEAVSGRVYITYPGGGSGTEALAWNFAPADDALPVNRILDDYGQLISSTPPTRSTAWLPANDGAQFSIGTMYDWLNQGLNKLSHSVEGILDYCGVPTVAGQPLYVIPGQWLSISDVWYGGYWIQGGRRADFFRRNTVTSSVLSNVTISITAGKQVMEVSYQPNRDSGVTQIEGGNPLSATDTSVVAVDASVFQLPFGFLQISNPNHTAPHTETEICSYAGITGNTLGGLIRGIGNTTAQAWDAGSTITELSLFWCGRRVFDVAYSPIPVHSNLGGRTQPIDPVTTVLPIPVGWGPILQDYMLAQAKFAEQDVDTGSRLEQGSFDMAQRWMLANKGVAKFVQVGPQQRPYIYDDTIAGGLIQPS